MNYSRGWDSYENEYGYYNESENEWNTWEGENEWNSSNSSGNGSANGTFYQTFVLDHWNTTNWCCAPSSLIIYPYGNTSKKNSSNSSVLLDFDYSASALKTCMKGGINETDFWAVANFTGNPYDATIYAQQINVTNQTGYLYTFEYWNY